MTKKISAKKGNDYFSVNVRSLQDLLFKAHHFPLTMFLTFSGFVEAVFHHFPFRTTRDGRTTPSRRTTRDGRTDGRKKLGKNYVTLCGVIFPSVV